MDVSLDANILDQLNTTETKALHDISDSLSACGVGRIVNLPQIIVVGDQSVGKSSVLEAISHVRFPVQGNLCTRFATELIFRRANETRIDVSVRFEDRSKPAKRFQRAGFREDDLGDIITEAKECMGFGKAGMEFSKDVLRLEIEGPKMYPLSLVDLPGFFHVATENQSISGKETVDQLVESYMRQKNSIILVVITANNNLANHLALQKTKNIDPERRRTIGVITKPDLTRPGYDAEKEYIKLAKNQEPRISCSLGGMSCVTGLKMRTAWQVETRSKTHSSRRALGRLFPPRIVAFLPGVIIDIETTLRERQEELDRLGKSRSTQEDLRSFLLGIASDFQRLARDGIYGRYNDEFFGGLQDDHRKLRAQLHDDSDSDDDEIPRYLEKFLESYPYNPPQPKKVTRSELAEQLEKQAAANQGLEFPGTPNKDLAMQLFKQQSAPWRGIAESHVKLVTTVAKAFVDQVFEYVVGSPRTNRTTEAILSTCVDPFFDEKEKTKSWRRISAVLQENYPHLYESKTAKTGETSKKVDSKTIAQDINEEDDPEDSEFGINKVIDMMLIYYTMSLRTFTDNVINLAVESCLVYDIPDILTPTKVDRMSKERLEELAGESDDTSSRRKRLQEEVEFLRQGLAQCRRYKPRAVTPIPSAANESLGSVPNTSSIAPSVNDKKTSPPSVINAPKAQFNGWTTIPDLPKAENPFSKFLNTPAKSSSPTPSATKPASGSRSGSGLFGSGAATSKQPAAFQFNGFGDAKK
ncbi:putative dynamin GTPase [Fusarium sp. MPI-SDFR-AT-0072]|nr:putative dynamin GTPase [Fusarium sp. MPI-SDFR-AT-0072]